jgi:hypothetical protein
MIVFHVVSLMPDGMTTRSRCRNDNVNLVFWIRGNEIVDFDHADLLDPLLREGAMFTT